MDRLTLVDGNQNSVVAAAHEQAGEKACAAGNEGQHGEALHDEALHGEPAQAPLDSGLLSLVMLARFHGTATEPEQLAHEFRVPGKYFDEEALLLACKKLGLQARAVTTKPERLAKTPLPALAQMKDGRFVIVAKLASEESSENNRAEEGAGRVLVQSPEVGRPELLELDATEAQADLSQLGHDSENGRLQVARAEAMLQAIRTGKAPTLGGSAQGALANISAARLLQEQGLLSSEWLEYQSKLAQLSSEIQLRQAQKHASQARIAKLQKSLLLTREREADFARLQKEKYVARHDWITQKQQVIEQEGELASEQASLEEHGAGIIEAQRQMVALTAKLSRTWQDKLREGQQQAHNAGQGLVKARQRDKLRRMTAPVSGTVQQLAVHTVGGVVTPAQPLMVIVPDDHPLEIEAFLENKDIGFVSSGQRATVKVEAFPYTKYDTLQGEVVNVSGDAINDEKRGLIYSTRVTLAQTDIAGENKRVKLRPSAWKLKPASAG